MLADIKQTFKSCQESHELEVTYGNGLNTKALGERSRLELVLKSLLKNAYLANQVDTKISAHFSFEENWFTAEIRNQVYDKSLLKEDSQPDLFLAQ